MAEIQFENDVTGALEKTHGSDGRLNVSSRSDSRAFYVSRDNGQAYVLRSEDDDAVQGDLLCYLRNDSTNKKLYVESINVSVQNKCTIKVAFGDSGAASGGSALTPVNLNRESSNAADVTARGDGAIGTVAASTFIATERLVTNTSIGIQFNDALILGQNDNIVVEYDTGLTGDVEVDIFFFLE